MPRPLRPVVYGSSSPGTGSTVRGVFELHKNGYVPNVDFACVLTGSADAGIVEIAREYKIPEERIGIFPRSQYASSEEHQKAIIAFCDHWDADALWQSGRLGVLGSLLLKRFQGRNFNQHPGKTVPGHTYHGERLDFGGPGMHGRAPYAAALYYARFIGQPDACAYVIAHHMNPDERNIDSGDTVRTLAVRMDLARDTPKTLQDRGKKAEQMLMAWVLAEFAATGYLPHMKVEPIARTMPEVNFLLAAREQAKREYPNG